MIYAGDPGMWDRWLEFQKNCKRARAAEERKKRVSNKKELEEILTKLLNFSTGYSAKVASQGLINLKTPTALNSAITYLSDRAWDETLIPATKRY